MRLITITPFLCGSSFLRAFAFTTPSHRRVSLKSSPSSRLTQKALQNSNNELQSDASDSSRRALLTVPILTACSSWLLKPQQSLAAGTFTPGGTLVDREVGVTVGNDEASPSRKVNNENVLFSQDNYFKFGVAAPW